MLNKKPATYSDYKATSWGQEGTRGQKKQLLSKDGFWLIERARHKVRLRHVRWAHQLCAAVWKRNRHRKLIWRPFEAKLSERN